MKFRSLAVVAVISLAAVLFTGCLGGGAALTSEQAVHKVLDDFERAISKKDAHKLASLLVYPLEMDGEYFESFEEAAAAYELGLAFFTEIHEFRLIDREITINGDEAVAEVTAKSKMTILGETLEDAIPGTLTFRRVGSTWKITGQ